MRIVHYIEKTSKINLCYVYHYRSCSYTLYKCWPIGTEHVQFVLNTEFENKKCYAINITCASIF